MLLGVLGIAAPERDDVLVAHQRPAALEVRHHRRTAARGQREVHRRRLAVGLGLGLVEVGVTVEEEQPVAAATLEREQAAEHDRAVAAEHDRKFASISTEPTASARAAE